jgi:hypothetical protein
MPHPIDSFFWGVGEINWISFDKKNDAPPNQVGGQLGAFIHKNNKKNWASNPPAVFHPSL